MISLNKEPITTLGGEPDVDDWALDFEHIPKLEEYVSNIGLSKVYNERISVEKIFVAIHFET